MSITVDFVGTPLTGEEPLSVEFASIVTQAVIPESGGAIGRSGRRQKRQREERELMEIMKQVVPIIVRRRGHIH